MASIRCQYRHSLLIVVICIEVKEKSFVYVTDYSDAKTTANDACQ